MFDPFPIEAIALLGVGRSSAPGWPLVNTSVLAGRAASALQIWVSETTFGRMMVGMIL